MFTACFSISTSFSIHHCILDGHHEHCQYQIEPFNILQGNDAHLHAYKCLYHVNMYHHNAVYIVFDYIHRHVFPCPIVAHISPIVVLFLNILVSPSRHDVYSLGLGIRTAAVFPIHNRRVACSLGPDLHTAPVSPNYCRRVVCSLGPDIRTVRCFVVVFSAFPFFYDLPDFFLVRLSNQFSRFVLWHLSNSD